MGNLTLLERFDGTLASWTLDQTGGTATIVTKDLSTKLKLSDTSGADIVSAKRAFTEPSAKYIIEYDMMFPSTGGGVFELLDASNNVLATVEAGITANTVSFFTDTSATPVTATWASTTYNQIVLAVDPVGNTIKAYYFAAHTQYPQTLIGSKGYSGNVATQISFRTDAAGTGAIYVDEVKVYTPEFAIIGDSISQGVPQWSNDPNTIYRLTNGWWGTGTEVGNPAYQLSQLIDAGNYWVGNRGFGGSKSYDVAPAIQSNIIDQGFTKLIIHVGTNDINTGETLAAIESNLQSTVNTLLAGGFSPSDIYLFNVYGSALFGTTTKQTLKNSLNAWISSYCTTSGVNFVDGDANISNYPTYPYQIVPAYNVGDGVHLNAAGSGVLASLVYNIFIGTPTIRPYSFGGVF